MNGKVSPHATEQMIREPEDVSKATMVSILPTHRASKFHDASYEQSCELVSFAIVSTTDYDSEISLNLSLGDPAVHLRCSNVVSRPQTPNVKPASKAHNINNTSARMDIPIQAP